MQNFLKVGALLLLLSAAACGGGGSGGTALPRSAEEPVTTAVPRDAQATLAAAARPIAGAATDFDELIAEAGRARRVLLGESTHGTHEYYRDRGRITERLIREHGFNAIAIEGDWSPTWRLNLYVRGLGGDRSAEEAMGGYTRFPRWMWPNAEFRDFVERLRALNMERPEEQRVGLYGMDVYDLQEAAEAVVGFLRRADPAAARRAGRSYDCFDPYDETADYGAATQNGRFSCRKEAEAARAEMVRIPRPGGPAAAERHFAATRAAASVVAAEEYFRTAYAGSLAWNARDRRMEENVEAIAVHVEQMTGRPAKVAIWGHNTHTGDARATSAANRGELNLGQLMRQRHGEAAFLVGFFTYSGSVLAAPEWDQPGRVYEVPPALPGSYAALFHASGIPAFSIVIRGSPALRRLLAGPMLERAIGVLYLPHSERTSHYFEARVADQFDAAVYFDRSKAVTPLRR